MLQQHTREAAICYQDTAPPEGESEKDRERERVTQHYQSRFEPCSWPYIYEKDSKQGTDDVSDYVARTIILVRGGYEANIFLSVFHQFPLSLA